MNIYALGILGAGMSGLAQLLNADGHSVKGSDFLLNTDSSHGELISSKKKSLESKGIVLEPQGEMSYLNEKTDLVIYSQAVPETIPEIVFAREKEIDLQSYAQALGVYAKEKKLIAVSGTHGKTTTTALLSTICIENDLDPSVLVGAKVGGVLNESWRYGKSDYFILEACEYKGNFDYISPHILIINNLEPDHLDYFKTAENYYKSFSNLAQKLGHDDYLVLGDGVEDYLNIELFSAKIIFAKDYKNIKSDIVLSVPGVHNKQNALSAFMVADILGIDHKAIFSSLENFTGASRRQELKGSINKALVYDDYGHHPTEVKLTVQAFKNLYPDKKIVLIFQPHQYSRTRVLLSSFLESFSFADEVWLTDIYEARDTLEDKKAINAKVLVDMINDVPAFYFPQEKLAEQIINSAKEGIIFLVMGAGNIVDVFQKLPFNKF